VIRPTPRTLVVAALVALGLLLVAGGGWAWWQAQQQRVRAAFAEVMPRVQVAQAPDATAEARAAAVQALEQVLQRYPSAGPVAEAAYELGNLRYAAGQYAPARSAYEIALGRGPSGTLGALARAGVARTWEAQRDFARAVEAYQALVRDLEPRSFLYEDALIDWARALELAGRKPEAIAAYQRVLKDVPTARRADEVRIRLAGLGAPSR
jgi:tetratricopeptide (TPR) repeat protein